MNLKDIMRSLSDKREITSPIFKKEFNSNPTYLVDLENLLNDQCTDIRLVTEHIELFKQGLLGEAAVFYELKNSMLPFICFHDIRIEERDYSAQIDFLVISHSGIYIIETNKLFGDIEVNENGEFIRNIKNSQGAIVKKEGMFSPITQSDRHVRILTEILKNNSVIKQTPVKSIVVLANPRSIIDKSKAPIEIRNSIIKVDQLVSFFTNEFKTAKKIHFMLDKFVYQIADFITNNNKPIPLEIEKYKLKNVETASAVEVVIKPIVKKIERKLTDDAMYKDLKAFRLLQSKKEQVKPFFIFYNSTLDQLIAEKPTSTKALLNISGFGEVKVQKYGEAIIEIVRKYV